MATFNKIADFVENLAHGVINLNVSGSGGDSFLVALSNTSPAAETPLPTADGQGILGNVTQVAYTNLSTRALVVAASAQTSGTYKWDLTDLTLTASGGAVATFQWIYIYDDTPTAPVDPLIGYYDYGSGLTLADGESLTIDFDGTNGVLTLT